MPFKNKKDEISHAKAYYLKNKEKVKAYNKKFYRENSKLCILRNQKWKQKNPERALFIASRSRAKKKGLEFSIGLKDIIIPEKCPILGVSLTYDLGVGPVRYNKSLDRVDTSKGYVKGNIQVVSDLANRMKRDATKEELLAFAKGIIKYYGATL